MEPQRPTIVGIFPDRGSADDAIDELRKLGFGDDQIGFAVRGGTATATDNQAGEGAGAGMLAGAGVGGAAAVASLFIPGIGPIMAAGILTTMVGGMAAGAAVGGIIGTLTGLGIPEDEAHYYESEFSEGRVLVTVRPQGRQAEVLDIMVRHGARSIQDKAA